MCGIAGYITTTPTSHKLKIATAIMAIHMDERGGHSWGWMSETHTQRGLGSINTGLRIAAKMPRGLALHTRYATTGARTIDNAHPFTAHGSRGTVTGVHNGIISNHHELNAMHKRECAVDSQHIFQNLADGRNLDELEGYGAIVYVLNGEWFIGRFNDGDMKVALTDAGIFFASTKAAVTQAASYADATISKWLKVRDNTVYRLTASGLAKAYKVEAQTTTRRWNDKFDSYSAGTPDPSDDAWPQRCDYCQQQVKNVYDLDRSWICADCYFEMTDRIPAGYSDVMDDPRAYSFDMQRTN
jgi:asparagine synthetase B (glutamine-hydrolysing)